MVNRFAKYVEQSDVAAAATGNRFAKYLEASIDEQANPQEVPDLSGAVDKMNPLAQFGIKALAAKEAAVSGLTRGWGDEVYAAVGSPIRALVEGESIPEAYRNIRDEERRGDELLQKVAPDTSTAFDVAGSLASPLKIAPTVAGRIGQSALDSGISSLGRTTEENGGDQAAEALGSASAGAGISSAIEAVSPSFGRAFRALTGRNADTLSRAEKFVVSKLESEGRTPEQITAILEEAGNGPVPRTVGEIADNNSLLAAQKRFTQNPEPAGDVVRGFNTERFQQTIPNTVQQNIRGISPITSPDLAGRKAKETAGEIIGTAKKTRKELAEPLYEASKTALVPDDIFRGLQEDDILGSIISGTRKDKLFNARVKELPDNSVGYLNQVKKKIDSQISVLKNKGDLERASILMESKKRLVDTLSESSPDYAKALDTFSDESTKIRGVTDTVVGVLADLKEGSIPKAVDKVFNQTPDQIIKAKRLITKQNPKAWDQLVASNLQKQLDDSRNIEGFIRKLDETPNLQKRLSASFSNTQQRRDFELLIRHMREATKVKMGSDTASNLAIDKMLDDELGSKIAKEASRDVPIRQRVAGYIGSAVQGINDRILMGNSEEVAKILTGKESRQLAKKLGGQKPGSPKALEEISKFLSARVTPIAAQNVTNEE